MAFKIESPNEEDYFLLNGLVFASEAEAKGYAANLKGRKLVDRNVYVKETNAPVTHVYDGELKKA